MTRAQIIATLNLPPNTSNRNLAARALSHCCAGGVETNLGKEWAIAVANSARTALHDPRRGGFRAENQRMLDVGKQAVERFAAIQEALLAALERKHDWPAGTLTRYLRDTVPGD